MGGRVARGEGQEAPQPPFWRRAEGGGGVGPRASRAEERLRARRVARRGPPRLPEGVGERGQARRGRRAVVFGRGGAYHSYRQTGTCRRPIRPNSPLRARRAAPMRSGRPTEARAGSGPPRRPAPAPPRAARRSGSSSKRSRSHRRSSSRRSSGLRGFQRWVGQPHLDVDACRAREQARVSGGKRGPRFLCGGTGLNWPVRPPSTPALVRPSPPTHTARMRPSADLPRAADAPLLTCPPSVPEHPATSPAGCNGVASPPSTHLPALTHHLQSGISSYTFLMRTSRSRWKSELKTLRALAGDARSPSSRSLTLDHW